MSGFPMLLSPKGKLYNMPFGFKSFAKPDMASQNWRKKLPWYNQLSNHSMQLPALILRNHFWFHKAHEPVRQIVGYCTTGWNPSLLLASSFCSFGFSIFIWNLNWLCKTMQGTVSIYPVIKPIDAVNCFNLAKTLLALPNVWNLRDNYESSNYCFHYFIMYFSLKLIEVCSVSLPPFAWGAVRLRTVDIKEQ